MKKGRGGLRAYAGCVNDGVDALDRLAEVARVLEVVDLDKVEALGVLGAGGEHGLALGGGAGGAPDPQAAGEEGVDDVGADEARGPGDEDVLAGVAGGQHLYEGGGGGGGSFL